MPTPANLKYSKTHEWVKIEGTNATVGITGHAQEALGDITFVELPKVGADVYKDGACCVIESVKAASDINAPVSGRVSEVNGTLENAPESVNSSSRRASACRPIRKDCRYSMNCEAARNFSIGERCLATGRSSPSR